jgi:PAS domain S-box-containing protein
MQAVPMDANRHDPAGTGAAAPSEREDLLARYRAMAEEASDIVVLHEGGHIVCATGALWRLLKRTPAEFENGRYLDLVHPDDMPEARKLLGTPPAEETWTATYRVRHADGHYVWFEVRTRAEYHEQTGALLREVSVGRDITERKEQELRVRAAQERAEAANRAKSAFLANMSHELRTPLNAIIGFADLMRQEMLGPLGNSRYTEYAASISESGGTLLRIVANVLDIARIEADAVALNPTTIDLEALLTECADLVRPAAQKADVAITTRVSTPPIEADPDALRQIVLNLLGNAINFTPQGGRVSVEAEIENGTAVLRVRDTGAGIAANELPRLGRPFAQMFSDAAHARHAAGMGLGLAIVRALTEAHGGQLAIQSALGAGTVVTVRLPLSAQTAAAA